MTSAKERSKLKLAASLDEVPILRRVDVLRVLRAIFFESVVEQVVFVITKSLLRR